MPSFIILYPLFHAELQWHPILAWKYIFKVNQLKQVYLNKLTDDARKTSDIRGQNRNTKLHLTWKKSILKHTAWFSIPIFISSENHGEPHCPI